MMLIHDEIKGPLATIPFYGFEDGAAHPPTANDVNSINDLFGRRSRIFIRVPIDLVPALHEGRKIGQGHPLGPARQGILRVAPAQHQEAHVTQIGCVPSTAVAPVS